MQAFRRKALACLREGRVTVLEAGHVHFGRPTRVTAAVRSSRDGGPTYAVDLVGSAWACTCRAGHPCAHSLAVALVTGWAAQ